MAGNEVRFDVVASDKASKILDDVADKAEQVEKLDPTVDVAADTRAADHSVEGFADQLDKLTGADQIVVMALRAAAAQSELSDLATKIATLDASDPTSPSRSTGTTKCPASSTTSKRRSKRSATPTPTAGAAPTWTRPGEAQRPRRRSRQDAGDAVHAMAGGAIGDFAATATGIGPLGEALGQITEAALAGETSLKDLAKAGARAGRRSPHRYRSSTGSWNDAKRASKRRRGPTTTPKLRTPPTRRRDGRGDQEQRPSPCSSIDPTPAPHGAGSSKGGRRRGETPDRRRLIGDAGQNSPTSPPR